MADRDQPLLAVLIDADNIDARLADEILKEVNALGEPGLRRVYGDWSDSNLSRWSKQARELGLVTRQATANTKGKNATDIELVIDAMDILREERFDGFVLVSGDSDFTALGNRLRENGKTVVGIGRRENAAASFVNICNRYIFLENITSETTSGTAKSDKKKPKANLDQAYQRIRNTINKIDQDSDWVALGTLGKAVTSAYPDFDTRSYGFGKLSALIRAIPQLEIRSENNQPEVRLKP
jgi:hypothetical protein